MSTLFLLFHLSTFFLFTSGLFRLSSTSSKDSGHNSGTIDRSTTASSNSASSKGSEEERRRSEEEESHKSDPLPKSCRSPARNVKSDLAYSTDSEFYYVDGTPEQISDFYRELKDRGVEENHLSHFSHINSTGNYIDPIYEMIPEGSEVDELYCLPQDAPLANSRDVHRSSSSPSRPTFTKSQEKLRSLCRSISSPMRMNEYLMSRVKRSSSNHSTGEQEPPTSSPVDVTTWLKEAKKESLAPPRNCQTEPSLRLGAGQRAGSTLSLVVPERNNGGIVYTNLDNLERTIRLQQERLLREREEERLRPKFSAPPPPCHPPPAGGHELATSFRGEGSTGTWEWKVKVRPDGSRYIARRPVRSQQLRERGRRIE